MEFQSIDLAAATPAVASFEISRTAFAGALAFLDKVIERRNTIPILSNVRIDASPEGMIRLTGTDLDIEASIDLAATVLSPGAFTADVRLLSDVVKGMAGDTVSVQQTEGKARIASSRAAMNVSTLPVDDYPALAAGELDHRFSFPAPQLAGDLALLTPSISTEETRYYLNGIFMHATCDGVRLASTDGHRLGLVKRELPDGMRFEGAGDVKAMPDVIMPRKFVALLVRLIGKDKDGEIAFALSGKAARVTYGAVTLTSKMIDGTFPDYQRVIPAHNDKVLNVNPKSLWESVKRVAAVASERTRAVRLALRGDRVEVSVTSAENGTAFEEVPAAYEAEEFEIGFNATYLIDMMKLAGKAESVTVTLADASAPTLFTYPSLPHFSAVLMPMRVDGIVARPVAYVPPAPVVPVETAREAFGRIYRAAWDARDHAALAAVCAYYKAWLRAESARTWERTAANRATDMRLHADLAAAALSARVGSARQETYRARNEKRIRGRLLADCNYMPTKPTEFGERLQRCVAYAQRMIDAQAALDATGFNPHDPRALLPLRLNDGKRVFVCRADFADMTTRQVPLRKADGSFAGRGRARPLIARSDIAEVLKPHGKQARADWIWAIGMASRTAPPETLASVAIAENTGLDPVALVAEPASIDDPAPADADDVNLTIEPAVEAVENQPETAREASPDVAALVATVQALVSRVANLEAAARGERTAKVRTGVRLLMVKRYLAMRAERFVRESQRTVWSRSIDDLTRKLESMTEEANYQRGKKERANDQVKALQGSLATQASIETLWTSISGAMGYANRMAAKRARSTVLARDLRKRLAVAAANERQARIEAQRFETRCNALESHAAASNALDRRPAPAAVQVAPGAGLIIMPTVASRPRVQA